MSKHEHYTHSEARGGEAPHTAKHNAGLKHVEAKTKHLTHPEGGARSIGDQGPHERTKMPKSDMGPVKRAAGGSNY